MDVLQPLSDTAAGLGISLVMHVKPKAEDGSTQLQAMIEAIKAVEDSQVGWLGGGQVRSLRSAWQVIEVSLAGEVIEVSLAGEVIEVSLAGEVIKVSLAGEVIKVSLAGLPYGQQSGVTGGSTVGVCWVKLVRISQVGLLRVAR